MKIVYLIGNGFDLNLGLKLNSDIFMIIILNRKAL